MPFVAGRGYISDAEFRQAELEAAAAQGAYGWVTLPDGRTGFRGSDGGFYPTGGPMPEEAHAWEVSGHRPQGYVDPVEQARALNATIADAQMGLTGADTAAREEFMWSGANAARAAEEMDRARRVGAAPSLQNAPPTPQAAAAADTQARRDALLQKFHELASGRTKSDAELEFEKQYQAAAQASYGSATNVKGVNSVDAANFRSSQQAEMQSNQMATQKALHESIAKAARQQEAALAADIAKGAMSKEALDNWYAQGLAGIDAASGRSAFNTSFQGAAGEYGRTSRQGRNALTDWYAQDSSARGAAQAGAGALGAGLSMYSTFKGK